MDELGRRALTEVYRQLLLGVITELWVDYLTQMEALRVSIGLEAYGQRDPLVEYKKKAFELFQNLLKDMRSGVISRMFTYRPRVMSSVQSEMRRPATVEEFEAETNAVIESGDGEEAEEQPADGNELEAEVEEEQVTIQTNQPQMSKSQKRRRHRR
jgi:preprotein translocase subunit SecA